VLKSTHLEQGEKKKKKRGGGVDFKYEATLTLGVAAEVRLQQWWEKKKRGKKKGGNPYVEGKKKEEKRKGGRVPSLEQRPSGLAPCRRLGKRKKKKKKRGRPRYAATRRRGKEGGEMLLL